MHIMVRYKERLNLKFLQNSGQSGRLDGSRWTFIADDIDDFRSGVPVKTKGSGMVKKNVVNPVPLIDTRSSGALKKSSSTSRTTPQINSRIKNDHPGLKTLYTK